MEAVALTYEIPELSPGVVREKNGVVYTKTWVVDLILDMTGYTPDRPLGTMLCVEPSAGDGSFLLRAAARLIESCRTFGIPLIEARSALLAYELDPASAARAV